MKYKYVLRNSLYLDEELQDYFNEMSKNGWRLDFVGYYYRFIKDEHTYKYQIDYTPASNEYDDLLEEIGYHEVDNSFEGFKVLENNLDLVMCSYIREFKDHSKEKIFNLPNIRGFLILAR